MMFLLMLLMFPIFPSCTLPILQDIILRALNLAQFFCLLKYIIKPAMINGTDLYPYTLCSGTLNFTSWSLN